VHALRPRVPRLVHLHRLAQGDDPGHHRGCVEVCPFDALHWSPQFEYAEVDILDLLHEKERLGEWMATVPPPPALDEKAAEPAEVAAASRPARGARGPAGGPGGAGSSRPPRTVRPRVVRGEGDGT
jgi:NADH-quinone oxidoreductase subunit I